MTSAAGSAITRVHPVAAAPASHQLGPKSASRCRPIGPPDQAASTATPMPRNSVAPAVTRTVLHTGQASFPTHQASPSAASTGSASVVQPTQHVPLCGSAASSGNPGSSR